MGEPAAEKLEYFDFPDHSKGPSLKMPYCFYIYCTPSSICLNFGTVILQTEVYGPISWLIKQYLVAIIDLPLYSTSIPRVKRLLKQGIFLRSEITWTMHHFLNQYGVMILNVSLSFFVIKEIPSFSIWALGREERKEYCEGEVLLIEDFMVLRAMTCFLWASCFSLLSISLLPLTRFHIIDYYNLQIIQIKSILSSYWKPFLEVLSRMLEGTQAKNLYDEILSASILIFWLSHQVVQ